MFGKIAARIKGVFGITSKPISPPIATTIKEIKSSSGRRKGFSHEKPEGTHHPRDLRKRETRAEYAARRAKLAQHAPPLHSSPVIVPSEPWDSSVFKVPVIDGKTRPSCPARQGVVVFLLPDRLLQFNAEDPERPRTKVLLTTARTRLEMFSSMALGRDGGLWIAGERGCSNSQGPCAI